MSGQIAAMLTLLSTGDLEKNTCALDDMKLLLSHSTYFLLDDVFHFNWSEWKTHDIYKKKLIYVGIFLENTFFVILCQIFDSILFSLGYLIKFV